MKKILKSLFIMSAVSLIAVSVNAQLASDASSSKTIKATETSKTTKVVSAPQTASATAVKAEDMKTTKSKLATEDTNKVPAGVVIVTSGTEKVIAKPVTISDQGGIKPVTTTDNSVQKEQSKAEPASSDRRPSSPNKQD